MDGWLCDGCLDEELLGDANYMTWSLTSPDDHLNITKDVYNDYRYQRIFTESITSEETKTNSSLVKRISKQLFDDGVLSESFVRTHPKWSLIQDCRCRFAQKMSTDNTLHWYGGTWADELRKTTNSASKQSKSSMISRFMKSVS